MENNKDEIEKLINGGKLRILQEKYPDAITVRVLEKILGNPKAETEDRILAGKKLIKIYENKKYFEKIRVISENEIGSLLYHQVTV